MAGKVRNGSGVVARRALDRLDMAGKVGWVEFRRDGLRHDRQRQGRRGQVRWDLVWIVKAWCSMVWQAW